MDSGIPVGLGQGRARQPPETLGIRVIAADQFGELGTALASGEPFAIIGGYEFLLYILDKSKHRYLVEASNIQAQKYPNPYCFSPLGEPLSVKRFVEEFTMSLVANWVVLREEGFLPVEIKTSVGSDGSLLWSTTPGKSLVLHSPASIPDKEVQLEIIRCLGAALSLYEANSADPIAILQAKAKNFYFLKRSIVRHVVKNTA